MLLLPLKEGFNAQDAGVGAGCHLSEALNDTWNTAGKCGLATKEDNKS